MAAASYIPMTLSANNSPRSLPATPRLRTHSLPLVAEPESYTTDLTLSLPDLRAQTRDLEVYNSLRLHPLRTQTEPFLYHNHHTAFIAAAAATAAVARQRLSRRRSLRRVRSFPRADTFADRPLLRNFFGRRTMPTLDERNTSSPRSATMNTTTSTMTTPTRASGPGLPIRGYSPNNSGFSGHPPYAQTTNGSGSVGRNGRLPPPIFTSSRSGRANSSSGTSTVSFESDEEYIGDDSLGASLGFEAAQGRWVSVRRMSADGANGDATCSSPANSDGQMSIERSIW